MLSYGVFPTQDGPAHRYYAGILGGQLFDPSWSETYRVRMPVPPYAAEDYLLAAAPRVMDVGSAERIFLCACMVLFTAGVRLCCVRAGQAGAWVSLFAVPLAFFMLAGAFALFLVIPVMPDKINGALDFFIRMLPMVWVLALFAASRTGLSTRARQAAMLGAAGCTAVALIAAESALRPVARQLEAVERLNLPETDMVSS